MKIELESQQLNMYYHGDLIGAIFTADSLEVELERFSYPCEDIIKVKLSLNGGIGYSIYYSDKVTMLIDNKEVEVNVI